MSGEGQGWGRVCAGGGNEGVQSFVCMVRACTGAGGGQEDAWGLWVRQRICWAWAYRVCSYWHCIALKHACTAHTWILQARQCNATWVDHVLTLTKGVDVEVEQVILSACLLIPAFWCWSRRRRWRRRQYLDKGDRHSIGMIRRILIAIFNAATAWPYKRAE